ncbi:MAG: DUF2007 domain-containing protein [Planctomycetaceae bacterium]|nr:DUF2007 domain-containing protein [Planctomycetaceae bacterium]
MELNLKTIVTYATPEEAEVARAVLENEGIVASFENASFVGMAWYLSNAVGGVKLQVSEADETRARNVLAETVHAASSQPTSVRSCAACGAELPERFDVCWYCGAALDAEPGAAAPLQADASAVAQVANQELAEEVAPGDEHAWRAFCAAVIGIFVCPPILNLYSIWILLRLIASGDTLSRKGKRYVVAAMLVDLALGLSAGWLVIGGLQPPQ